MPNQNAPKAAAGVPEAFRLILLEPAGHHHGIEAARRVPQPGTYRSAASAHIAGFELINGRPDHGFSVERIRPVAEKEFSSLQARFALAGHALVRTTDGQLCASRWGYTRTLADVAEAEAFLRQIGG